MKDPGKLIQGTGGFIEHGGLFDVHSFTSTTQAGSEPEFVQPSSHIHVYFGYKVNKSILIPLYLQ